ncbi:glycoside hydrolase family 95 protein [Paractinoplanes rishiriensis]|uniref:Alpha/beta hydrolase n=1 Tax=Paractinoplanes rishiriensis TaxID=1050105 RepID=A0A919JTD1_9ACTN|nr:glycoside hydrolase family 95 protein [Actinoplanes rishiriensis]GIE94423.1 alpha/beta hydrolase [Actinoplanes rishiriensis]
MIADALTTLRYRAPAEAWTDALPLGNGRLGAMAFGGVEQDRFQLNEGTCWSGSPVTARGTRSVHDGPGLLRSARTALAAGDVRVAEALLQRFQGGNCQAYQPLGDLWIGQRRPRADDEPDAYQRHLDLRSAVASHTYHSASGRVSQEAWISHGAQALVIRRRVQQTHNTPILLRLTSPHPTAVTSTVVGGLDMVVRMPSSVPSHPEPVAYDPAPHAAVTALTGLRVLSSGVMTAAGEQVKLDDADELILVLTAVTDYVDPLTAPHGDVDALTRTLHDRLDALAASLAHPGGYNAMRAAHERSHAQLFSRVGLHLGAPQAAPRLDTADRIQAHADGETDPALAALQFQYGRYLMITGSRPGGLPANLQGLWNDHLRPPWNGNYTTNINLEMNYWPAEVANLPECHLPLLDWLGFAARSGKDVARTLYGLDGWTMHHNSDAWCFGLPSGVGHDEVKWSFWPLAGAWLSRHVADHYDFTRDVDFLATRGWPILRDAAAFCLDWLVPAEDGSLGTAPSTSPENQYVAADGRPAAVTASTTADLVLIRDLLTNVVRLSAVLTSALSSSDADLSAVLRSALSSSDADLVARAQAALARIPAERIGADGRLAEWPSDVADAEPSHRHTSHLIGVYPGQSVTPDTTPALAEAARLSLDARGPESTGWSLAWRIALRARLRDTEGAAEAVRYFLRPAGEKAGIYLNLFCAHPPFQIDGNYGFTAGVAEMLLQSHATTEDVTHLHLLPALPAAWSEGAFAGLCARGGVTVDATWKDGVLEEVRLLSATARRVVLRAGTWRAEVTTEPKVPYQLTMAASTSC